MEPAEALKLYLIGLLALIGLVVGGLVYFAVIPVADRISQGTQYLLVGVLLGAIFGFLGGFDDLMTRFRWPARHRAIQPHPSGSRLALFGRFDPRLAPAVQGSVEPPVRPAAVRRAPERARVLEPTVGLPVPVLAEDVAVRPTTALEVSDAVARHEAALVDQLVREGALSGHGPITDEDVRIMVVTSVISDELSERLLGFVDQSDAGGPCRGPARLVERTASD